MNHRFVLWLVLGALIVVGLVTFVLQEHQMFLDTRVTEHSQQETEERPTIRIGGTSVGVLIADTPDERRRGLAGRDALPENTGMLFVFDESDTYAIWMKDMTFAIDVIWISNGGVVVDVRERVAPETYPEVFGPRTSAQYVLEVPVGFASAHDVSVGTSVDLVEVR